MSLSNCGNLYKWLRICAGEFYSLEYVLTYGRPWNFITGPRSVGKTTATAIALLLDYIINGHRFFYLRRTRDELELTKKAFFNDAARIISEKTPWKISVENKGFTFFLHREDESNCVDAKDEDEGEENVEKPKIEDCGSCFYLSKEEKLKSGGSFIYNVVYDEFIAQDATAYLGTLDSPREYTKLLELYATLDRGVGTPYRNEVRVFLLGNTATIYNPIMMELDMPRYIQPTSRVIAPRGKAWLLHQLSDTDVKAVEGYKESFLYALSTEEQRDYNFLNRSAADSDATFVEKKPAGATPHIVLMLDKKRYGVYKGNNGLFYISTHFSKDFPTYALDVKSHDGVIDKQFIQSYGGDPWMRLLAEEYRNGRMRFENIKIKNSFCKYFNFIPI